MPGDSGSYVIYQNNNTLLVSAGGHNESIDVPSGATVGIAQGSGLSVELTDVLGLLSCCIAGHLGFTAEVFGVQNASDVFHRETYINYVLDALDCKCNPSRS